MSRLSDERRSRARFVTMKDLISAAGGLGYEYNEELGALVGQTGGYGAAIKESEATGSFGCLFWAENKMPGGADGLASYLESKKDIVKRFNIAGRGAAIALIKTGDTEKDSHNLKTFVKDITETLLIYGFRNCCYDCGATEDLGIYIAGNSPIQACSECGKKYKPVLRTGRTGSVKSSDELLKDMDRDQQDLLSAMAVAAAAVKNSSKPAAGTVDDLLMDASQIREIEDDRTYINTDGDETDMTGLFASPLPDQSDIEKIQKDKADRERGIERPVFSKEELDSLMADMPEGGDEKRETPAFLRHNWDASDIVIDESAITEERSEHTEPEKDEAVEALMFGGEEDEAAPAEEPVRENDKSDDNIDFGALLADSGEAEEKTAAAEPAEAKTEKADDTIDIGALLADSGEPEEKTAAAEPAEAKTEKADDMAALGDLLVDGKDKESVNTEKKNDPAEEKPESYEVKAALNDDVGDDSTVRVTELYDDSDEGEDIDVTEYVDDTDYGEDFDIEAAESDAGTPTVASGENIEANETPLEEDGSVPLINPNSGYVDRTVSSADGPDAVQPFDIRESITGTVDMAAVTSAGRPVRPRQQPDPYELNRNISYESANTVQKIRFAESSSPVFGIMGAIALGGAGMYIWTLFAGFSGTIGGFFGDILFAVGCLAIIAGVFGGYYLGGGALDGKGIAISAVTSVLYEIVGLGVSLVCMEQKIIENDFGYHISFINSIEWMMYDIGSSGNMAGFILRTVSSVLFMIIALSMVIKTLRKKL